MRSTGMTAGASKPPFGVVGERDRQRPAAQGPRRRPPRDRRVDLRARGDRDHAVDEAGEVGADEQRRLRPARHAVDRHPAPVDPGAPVEPADGVREVLERDRLQLARQSGRAVVGEREHRMTAVGEPPRDGPLRLAGRRAAPDDDGRTGGSALRRVQHRCPRSLAAERWRRPAAAVRAAGAGVACGRRSDPPQPTRTPATSAIAVPRNMVCMLTCGELGPRRCQNSVTSRDCLALQGQFLTRSATWCRINGRVPRHPSGERRSRPIPPVGGTPRLFSRASYSCQGTRFPRCARSCTTHRGRLRTSPRSPIPSPRRTGQSSASRRPACAAATGTAGWATTRTSPLPARSRPRAGRCGARRRQRGPRLARR